MGPDRSSPLPSGLRTRKIDLTIHVVVAGENLPELCENAYGDHVYIL